MDRYLFFSGDKPTIEDLDFLFGSLFQGILDRVGDLFTDGVVEGFTVRQDGSDLVVDPGVGYRDGERIVSLEGLRQDWPAGTIYVYVGYTPTPRRSTATRQAWTPTPTRSAPLRAARRAARW